MYRNTTYINRYQTCWTLQQYVSTILLLLLIHLLICLNPNVIHTVFVAATDYTTSTSTGSSNQCGQAYIGNITCGIVNDVTSIDILLYPPEETIYEVTMTWTKVSTKSGYYYKSYNNNNNNNNQPDTITTYYSNIASVKTISLSVMFSEPDTQSLTISILGFNDNYVTGDDTYTNNKWRDDEACYTIQKPSSASASTSASSSTSSSSSSNSWIVYTTKNSCSVTEPLSSSSSSSYSSTQPAVSSSITTNESSNTTNSSNYLYMNTTSIYIMIGILSFCTVTMALYIVVTRLRWRYHTNKKQIQQVSNDQLIDNDAT